MVFFTTPELLEIGNIPMTSLNEKPNRHEALKYYRRVADHFKLNIHDYERVENIAGRRWRVSGVYHRSAGLLSHLHRAQSGTGYRVL